MPESIRKLAAIMFADIVGYTAMMQEDESRAVALRDRHRVIVEDALNAWGGQLIQYYGDGTLSIFASAKDAVIGAREIQQKLCQEPRVPLRIGIHIGDVVQDDAGIYGDCVNVAARIESLAVPGAVLFSEKVKHELENQPSIVPVYVGEYAFKNVKRPMKIFALDDSEITVPSAGQVASGKHKKVSHTIAVLPFDNSGSDPDGNYIAEGISEEIMSGMSKVDGISVISRTTCLALQKSDGDLNALARKSNVSHLLEGRVRTAGNRVRVSVQLSKTADGFQVWSDVFDDDLSDIFTVQDQIAGQVIHAMKVNFDKNMQLGSESFNSKSKVNPDAHKLYLKGIHHWNKANPDDVKLGLDYLNEALAVEPQYSAAQCAISHCYSFLGSCGALPPIDAYAKALDLAMSAIENDSGNAEAHLAMANLKFYHYWDWHGAKKSLEKAEALGLNSALLHQSFGLLNMALGTPEIGVARMQKALEQDPLSLPMLTMLGNLYLFNQEYDKAISIFNEVLELNPRFRMALNSKAVTLATQGKYRESRIEFEEYHRQVGKPGRAIVGLIITNNALGETDKAESYMQQLWDRYENEAGHAAEIDLAIAHCGLKKFDRATEFLSQIYDQRLSVACMGVIWVLRCPVFKEFWSSRAHQDMLAKIGLPG